MSKDDDAKPLGAAAISAVSDIAADMVGELNDFRRLNRFLAEETGHVHPTVVDRIRDTIDQVHKVCESHIEIIALAKMMAFNVAEDGKMPSYPIVTTSRGKQPFVTITPQVKLLTYRADFVVDTPDGKAFIVECDGRNFHEASADQRRDDKIEHVFGIKTLRLTGREIWLSDAWLPMFGRWCRGKFFDRNKDLWLQEFEHRLGRERGDE
ncbi:hypothetical protein [Rhizobium sp. 2MFCol3.1]|uniref:hypothetical protein n=1 Tax=Rhizobium sp. 2MFCol3.1 TaxID=1246459 RepID=UPI0003657323|nr:hypothetical protein [Rhizobium sp. 2MFCol3.1]